MDVDYYPFGLAMSGISSRAMGKLENRFKFNDGTELENKEFTDGSGLDLYSTEFRSYDPQIGRFHQIDPLAEVADGWSPYSFAYNNPILLNDPYGLASDSANPQELAEVIVTAKKKNCQTCTTSNINVASAVPLPTGPPPLTLVPPTPPPGTVIPFDPLPIPPPSPLFGLGLKTLGLIGGVLWPTPAAGEGNWKMPNVFAPDPFKGHGNRRDNSNPHIVYQFTYTPSDGRTPVIKYGISDVSRNGDDRVKRQEAMFKSMYGSSVKAMILSRTVNRAQALFIERMLVTKHVDRWQEMPRMQDRPGSF